MTMTMTGTQMIDAGDGFKIATTFTLGGLQHIEKHYGKELGKIKFGRSTEDIIALLVALGVSGNPDMTVVDVERKVQAIQADKLNDILGQIPNVGDDEGNSTKGNLQEPQVP